MLGVFDQEKGKLTLSDIKSGAICRMEPRIHGIKYDASAQDAPKEDESNDLLALRRERNARLIEAFGSQRRKRQLANAQAGRVDGSQLGGGNAIINLIRSSKSAATTTGTKEDVIKQSLANRNIPPHNPDATTAEDAYPFDSIVPAIVQDSIDTTLLKTALDGSKDAEDDDSK